MADSAVTDIDVTTARQLVGSVTTDSTTSHRTGHLATSTPGDVAVHVTDLTDDMTSASHAVAADIDTSVKQTLTSSFTDAELSVTSLRHASHSSLAPISSTTPDDDVGIRPHTTLSIPHAHTVSTSGSSVDTGLARHSQSHSTAQLSSSYVTSIVTSVNSSRSSSSSSDSGSGSGGEVDLTLTPAVTALPVAAAASETVSSLSNVTHDSSRIEQFSATQLSRDNASSPVAPTAISTRAASIHSTLGLHSVAGDQTTITRQVVDTTSHTLTTSLQVSASTLTTKSHQLNATSFYGMLLSPRVSSDGTSAEPDSSTSSWSEWLTGRMTPGTSPSPAGRLDTTPVTRYESSDSVDIVSASHTSQLSAVNSTRQSPLPSTAHHHFSSLVTLNSSSNVTSRPVLGDSTEPSHDVTSSSLSTVNEPQSAENSTVPSFTANVTHYTSVNIASNYSTHEVTDSLSQVLSTSVNMMNFTDGPSTASTSSINVVDHQTHETFTDTATSTADSGRSTQSHQYVSEPRQSPASSSSTLPVSSRQW